MSYSLQKLVIEELQRDETPRTTAEIGQVITNRFGLTLRPGAVSVVMQTLKSHADYDLAITGNLQHRKYQLRPAKMSPAAVSREFEKLLWSVRKRASA